MADRSPNELVDSVKYDVVGHQSMRWDRGGARRFEGEFERLAVGQ